MERFYCVINVIRVFLFGYVFTHAFQRVGPTLTKVTLSWSSQSFLLSPILLVGWEKYIKQNEPKFINPNQIFILISQQKNKIESMDKTIEWYPSKMVFSDEKLIRESRRICVVGKQKSVGFPLKFSTDYRDLISVEKSDRKPTFVLSKNLTFGLVGKSDVNRHLFWSENPMVIRRPYPSENPMDYRWLRKNIY